VDRFKGARSSPFGSNVWGLPLRSTKGAPRPQNPSCRPMESASWPSFEASERVAWNIVRRPWRNSIDNSLSLGPEPESSLTGYSRRNSSLRVHSPLTSVIESGPIIWKWWTGPWPRQRSFSH